MVFQMYFESIDRPHSPAMEIFQRAKRRRLIESSSLEDFHDDLLVEILIRIPDYKCLFRYKSVCKRWFSLISTIDFRCRYISHQTSMNKIHRSLPFTVLGYPSVDSNPKSIFFRKPNFESPGFSFDFLPFSSPIRIIQTFNDLVLCCDSKNSESQMVYYICNPLTMQWTALPPVPNSSAYVKPRVCFICEPYYKEDPLQEHYGIALNAQQRFKVVRIIHARHKNICLEIFSSETAQWNQTVLSLPQDLALDLILEAVACEDGTKLILLGIALNQLVSITLDGENFDKYGRISAIPTQFLAYIFGLTLCKRTLRLAYLDGYNNLHIWELQEYHEWKLLQRSNIKPSRDYTNNRPQADAALLAFHPQDRDVLFVFFNSENRMVSYDMRKRSLNLIPNVCLEKFSWTFYPLVLPSWPTPIPQISDLMLIDN